MACAFETGACSDCELGEPLATEEQRARTVPRLSIFTARHLSRAERRSWSPAGAFRTPPGRPLLAWGRREQLQMGFGQNMGRLFFSVRPLDARFAASHVGVRVPQKILPPQHKPIPPKERDRRRGADRAELQ